MHPKDTVFTQQSFIRGLALPWGPTPYTFVHHFWQKGTPFMYLLLTNGTLFIPSLENCIPLNCCKCAFLKIWILPVITKPERFLDFFTAIKFICYPFWAFLPTEMTNFPTLSYLSWYPFGAESPRQAIRGSTPPSGLKVGAVRFAARIFPVRLAEIQLTYL